LAENQTVQFNTEIGPRGPFAMNVRVIEDPGDVDGD